MKTPELKPCPFCESANLSIFWNDNYATMQPVKKGSENPPESGEIPVQESSPSKVE